MTMRDFLPSNWSAFADWMANFNGGMTTLAAKYGLAGELTQLGKENDWVQYWIPAKYIAKQQESQLGDFVGAIVNGEPGGAQPTDPDWKLPADPPPVIPPGLKKRLRSLARQIKANPLFTKADGELLGIVAPEEAGISPETTTPEIKLRTLTNFAVEVEFRKYGFDALRVEYRHKGGNWILAAILTSSPGVFNIVPTTAGEAEQIEVRAVYLLKNQPFGNFSPAYSALIQP